MSNHISNEAETTLKQWPGYWNMIAQQTVNVFTDKFAQFWLIPLGAALAFQIKGIAVEDIAGVFIILPMVIFAPLAGWMSDRFSKRDVMLVMAVFQVFIMLGLCLSIHAHHMPLSIICFILLATQATFFSPAKIGICKELVGSKNIGFAANIQQMLALLGMLLGQIFAGWLFSRLLNTVLIEHSISADNQFIPTELVWKIAFYPVLFLTILASSNIILAYLTPLVPSHSNQAFSASILTNHFISAKKLWKNPKLKLASLGVGFFWGLAGFINIWSLKQAKIITHGGANFGVLASSFMIAASLGMVVGFGVGSFLLRKKIELGWVPIAAFGITCFALIISFCPAGSVIYMIMLSVLAFSSAIFLAPLNAWLQDNYPADQRGEFQAAVNLQDCMSGIIAVLFIICIEKIASLFHISPLVVTQIQMLCIALLSLFITFCALKHLAADAIRLLVSPIFKIFYRMKVTGLDNFPAEGGVLLAPNHITFLDSIYISLACPRPVRFVMDEKFIQSRFIRLFCHIFGTLPINQKKPLDTIRKTIHALNNGEVICIFPEGQLSRTGFLNHIQSGFELIAKKSQHPVTPVWMDGTWSSISSFERGNYFKKWPYRLRLPIHIAFGQSIESANANRDNLRQGLMQASTAALALHDAVIVPAPEQAFVRENSLQLLQNAFFQRSTHLHALKSDPCATSLLSLSIGLPALHHSSMTWHDTIPDSPLSGVWFGAEITQQALTKKPHAQTDDFAFLNFSTAEAHSHPNHFSALALQGRVIAISQPHPIMPANSCDQQFGHRIGSPGKLLPGFHIDQGRLQGVSLPEVEIEFPYDFDEENFLIPKSSATS